MLLPLPLPHLWLPNFNQFITYKLDETNYLLWLSQIVPILKGHELMGIVDGSEPCLPQFLPDDQGKEVPNPLHSIWIKKDQCLLSWINVTLTESVLATVYGLHTSRQVWKPWPIDLHLSQGLACITPEASTPKFASRIQVLCRILEDCQILGQPACCDQKAI
jgi:hypothetical protein